MKYLYVTFAPFLFVFVFLEHFCICLEFVFGEKHICLHLCIMWISKAVVAFQVCSMTVISGAGINLHTCESRFSPSELKANVGPIAFSEWCGSSVVNAPTWLHSMLVLNRPAVKKIAEHSCEMVSFTFNDLIWTLQRK